MAENHYEFDFSNLSADQLNAQLAAVTILAKRADAALKALKAEYLRHHDAGQDAENARFDGVDAASISVTRDGEGRWTVDDPIGYADWLAAHEAMCGTTPAVVEVSYPLPAAMGHDYIDRLVAGHGGEVPTGVKWRAGRAGGVTVRLAPGMETRAFDPRRLGTVALIAAGLGQALPGEDAQ